MNSKQLDKIANALAMSRKGAYNFVVAVAWTMVQNITLMFPMMLVFLTIEAIFAGTLTLYLWHFVLLGVAMIAIMYWVALNQYESTYPRVYAESATMRIRVAEKLRQLPLAFFDQRNASDLTSRIMGDVAFLENAYSHQLPQMAGSLLSVIVAGVGLAFLDWRLALALFWAVPVTILGLWLSLRSQKKTFERITQAQLNLNEKIEEGLIQHQTIKAYGAEERYGSELHEMLDAYEDMQMRTELSSGVVVNGLKTVMKLSLPTLVLVGSSLYLQGEVSMSILLFFVLVSVSVYTPLSTLMSNTLSMLFASLRIERMREIYNMERQEGHLKEVNPERFDVEFDKVSFSYDDNTQVLHNVSFTAKQGEVTALIGPSGGGKSTCAKLAARFWDSQSGTVRMGGVDVKEVDPEGLLAHYAIVFQEVVLFNNSVMENIRIGKKGATDEEVLEAARLAQCDSFVQRLPEGYHTLIGENGSRLSGGERQRISIARALLKGAPIVILDEATASQDAENETEIQRALSQLTRNKTVLIIAHRMRTIREADHIVVLSEGKVAQQGTPSQLYAEGGYYREACQLQSNRY